MSEGFQLAIKLELPTFVLLTLVFQTGLWLMEMDRSRWKRLVTLFTKLNETNIILNTLDVSES